MAAAFLCSMAHGYGVNNLHHKLPNRDNVNRKYQVLSQPNRRPLCLKIYPSTQKHYRVLFKCRSEHTDTDIEKNKEENISKATLIWRAIKLPMYTVALIPITVGSAAAYFQTGQYFGNRCLKLLVSSIFIIAWVNLSNDVYDFDTGADRNKKESVVNLVGSRTGTNFFAWLLLALGFVGLSWVSLEAGSLRSIFLLSCSIICGYIYQVTLSASQVFAYVTAMVSCFINIAVSTISVELLGTGRTLVLCSIWAICNHCLLFTSKWDKVVNSTHLIVTQQLLRFTDHFCYDGRELSISGTVFASSILVGFTTSLILFCSHFHQIEDDKAVGKISPLVRLGTEGGANIVKAAVVALYSLLIILGLGQTLPFSSIVLCASTLPIGTFVSSFVEKNHRDTTKIFMAKYYCVRLHTIFGAALAAGLVAARMFARKQLPHAVLL